MASVIKSVTFDAADAPEGNEFCVEPGPGH
jgi:hypothetical protein